MGFERRERRRGGEGSEHGRKGGRRWFVCVELCCVVVCGGVCVCCVCVCCGVCVCVVLCCVVVCGVLCCVLCVVCVLCVCVVFVWCVCCVCVCVCCGVCVVCVVCGVGFVCVEGPTHVLRACEWKREVGDRCLLLERGAARHA